MTRAKKADERYEVRLVEVGSGTESVIRSVEIAKNKVEAYGLFASTPPEPNRRRKTGHMPKGESRKAA
jgi:hypothetical protein